MKHKTSKNKQKNESSILENTHHVPSPFSRAMDALQDRYVYVAICVAGFLLYARTIFFDFTYFDDNVLILNNLPFLQNISNVLTAFRLEVFHVLHSSAAYYRPLLTISFMPDAMLGGVDATMYHITNILLHLIASCLVYKLLRSLGYHKSISTWSSLFFVVHPVLTQAVAWIPGRNDSLLAVFVLASFISLIRYTRDGRMRSLMLCAAFFLAALFTKESALVMPVLFFLYLWIHGALNRQVVLKLGGMFGVSAILWATARHFALVNPIPMTPLQMVQSVYNNAPAAMQLLGKVFFPVNLSVLPIIQDTTFIWGILACVVVISLFVWEHSRFEAGRRKNLIMMYFGLLWFLIFLFPSFIRPNPSIVADFIEHRLYIPMIGLVILLMESRLSKVFTSRADNVGHIVVGSITIIFSILTVVHSSNFSNRLIFWRNAAETSPHSPLAQRNLGAMYFLDGLYDLAEKHTLESLALNPEEQMAHNNLGLIYMQKGDLARAEKEYLQELAINPSYDNAHFNLGLLYYNVGRIQEAIRLWEKTLEINPDYRDAQDAIQNAKNTRSTP